MNAKSSVPESFEKELMHTLRFGGLDDANLTELVKIVAGFHSAGLKSVRAFPKGIPPVVDGVIVKGVLDTKELSSLLTKILTETPRLNGVVVFPYGIPVPDIFGVTLELGATIQAGEIGL